MCSQIIKIPSLGRPFTLGMLYDVHSDKIIPGKSLWDSDILKSASSIDIISQPSSRNDVITEDTIHEKSSTLGIEANLKLNVLGGMMDVQGAAKFLTDKRSSCQQARVTLKYSSTTRFEQLTMEQIGDIQYPEVLDDHHATHVVTGIEYGSDTFFVFDSFIDSTETRKIREIRGDMENIIKLLADAGADGLVHMSDGDKEKVAKFRCKFYSDAVLSLNSSTFDEAVQVYKELPQLLESNDKSIPKVVYLYPLSQLSNSKSQLIVRWITSDLIAQVEEILEGLHDLLMQANDLMHHDICTKFPEVGNQISLFQTLVNRFKLEFMRELATLLPKIHQKTSEVAEADLASLISSVKQSPFDPKNLEKYIKMKDDREIKQLAQFLENSEKNPRIQSAFPAYKLSESVQEEKIKHVICFAFNLSTQSTFLKMLEQYLQSGREKNTRCDTKEWYEITDESKKFRLKCTEFNKYVDALPLDATDTIFVITNQNEDIDKDFEKDFDCNGPFIIHYNDEFPGIFEPPTKPRNIDATNITTSSLEIVWDAPTAGCNLIESYEIAYCSMTDPKRMFTACTEGKVEYLRVKNLQPSTKYQFTVKAHADPDISEASDPYIVQSAHLKLAERLLPLSRQIISIGHQHPSVFFPPLKLVHANHVDRLYKYHVGMVPTIMVSTAPKPEKVLMLVGATGAGKSTLINGIVNYIFDVSWEDNFRFKVVAGGNRSQALSQTRDITAYTFQSAAEIPFNLTVIDTPGFGDTGGIERDKVIASQIKKFFSGQDRGGIDQLHGIGFVTQASLPRLTPTQRYIFDAVLSIFGKDIVDNIFLLITFADANEPPVLEAVKTAKIPYKHSFRFNNSALFASNRTATASPSGVFNAMFWEMGCLSFKDFFSHFSIAQAQSLALTRAVLQEREQLENLIPGLQQQVKVGLSQLDVIQQEEKVLQQHEAEIAANEGFTYKVDVPKFNKIPTDMTTTTCLVCTFTCHHDCAYPDDSSKQKCCAMGSNGCCKNCPDKCHWSKHKNLPYHVKYYTVQETRTYDDLKKRYESAKQGKERVKEMMERKEQMLSDLQSVVFSIIKQVTKSIERLNEIALKPNPLTEVEYLDLLIQTEEMEANAGWQRRVQQYQKIRKDAELLKKVSTVELTASKKSWWQIFTTSN